MEFEHSFVTVETWIHYYQSETKGQWKEWVALNKVKTT
jgi:hypothetical protein